METLVTLCLSRSRIEHFAPKPLYTFMERWPEGKVGIIPTLVLQNDWMPELVGDKELLQRLILDEQRLFWYTIICIVGG